MKSLVLGNSHVGAIFSAYKERNEIQSNANGLQNIFFAAIPQKELDECSLHSEKIYLSKAAKQRLTQTANFECLEYIDLNNFDNIVLVGGASPLSLTLQINTNRPLVIQPFSYEIAREIALNYETIESPIHKKSTFFDVIQETRRETCAWIPAPLPSSETPGLNWLERMTNDQKSIQINNNNKIRQICTENNEQCNKSKIILAKISTLCELQARTNKKYFINGRRFNGILSNDFFHANTDYGEITLSQILEFLRLDTFKQ